MGEEVTSWDKRREREREQTPVTALRRAAPLQIASLLIFKTTPQVDSENPILQMSKLGLRKVKQPCKFVALTSALYSLLIWVTGRNQH